MKDSPITKLELITVSLTAGLLGPSFGNWLADLLASMMIALMLLIWLVWVKYGSPML